MAEPVGEKRPMHAPRGLKRRAGDLVPALLVTAAILLVVEHWRHFEATDFALLLLILVSALVHWVSRPSLRAEERGGSTDESGRKRRPF